MTLPVSERQDPVASNLSESTNYNFEILITEDDGTTRIEWYEAKSEIEALEWATLGQYPFPQSATIVSSEEW